MQMKASLLILLQSAAWTAAEVSSNDTLLWGPYRPNLYFGVRPRIPKSLLTGLMWSNVDDFNSAQNNFRYTCEQHSGIEGYGWEEYDTRKGGREVIHDAGNKIDLTIDFVKLPSGSHGGSWGARISGKPRADAPANAVTSILWYTALEGLGSIAFAHERQEQGIEGPVTISGNTGTLGDFDIEIVDGPDNRLPYKTHEAWDEKHLDVTLAQSFNVPPDQLWRGREIAFSGFKTSVDELVAEYGQEKLPPPWQAFTLMNDITPGNAHIVQKVFVGAFQFDVLFKSGSGPALDSAVLEKTIEETSEQFKEKFPTKFKLQSPFAGKQEHQACAESMLSNLAGGIGYFYGDSLVDRSYASEYDEDDEGFWEPAAEARARNQPTPDSPAELFTSVPSRPFFPRGFLWDEGFHLIPIVDWDADLALTIIESWFNLMDDDGWIAREQILGPEARSKVPAEFQVQYPHYANPTTLFLVIEALASKVADTKTPVTERESLKSRLATLYPLLQKHYAWYRRTQAGDIKSYDRQARSMKEGYRWRGRTPRHILPSGLDDYPRAQPPTPGELHLDLLSWIGLMSRSLTTIGTILSSEETETYQKHLDAIILNLDDLHWSSQQKTYCDATIDDYEEHSLVCHKGYISLFPFMLDLLPHNHENIPAMLDLISDPEHLWSPYGIRSLSKQDALYGTDENYWRSPIWMNINYLIVKSLHTLATDTGKNAAPKKTRDHAKKIYNSLRKNLVDNVVSQWSETGFAWEQYNPETGVGQRTQHFTGWTSLVVVLMGMEDLSVAGVRDEL